MLCMHNNKYLPLTSGGSRVKYWGGAKLGQDSILFPLPSLSLRSSLPFPPLPSTPLLLPFPSPLPSPSLRSRPP